jgi:hypothetical protein
MSIDCSILTDAELTFDDSLGRIDTADVSAITILFALARAGRLASIEKLLAQSAVGAGDVLHAALHLQIDRLVVIAMPYATPTDMLRIERWRAPCRRRGKAQERSPLFKADYFFDEYIAPAIAARRARLAAVAALRSAGLSRAPSGW